MRKRRGSGFFAGIFVGVNDCINDANGVFYDIFSCHVFFRYTDSAGVLSCVGY